MLEFAVIDAAVFVQRHHRRAASHRAHAGAPASKAVENVDISQRYAQLGKHRGGGFRNSYPERAIEGRLRPVSRGPRQRWRQAAWHMARSGVVEGGRRDGRNFVQRFSTRRSTESGRHILSKPALRHCRRRIPISLAMEMMPLGSSRENDCETARERPVREAAPMLGSRRRRFATSPRRSLRGRSVVFAGACPP